eukprot:scaffold609_cov130-Cylindrotheca_fusiformis.AAC.14
MFVLSGGAISTLSSLLYIVLLLRQVDHKTLPVSCCQWEKHERGDPRVLTTIAASRTTVTGRRQYDD